MLREMGKQWRSIAILTCVCTFHLPECCFCMHQVLAEEWLWTTKGTGRVVAITV